jgi:hydroxymethylglutaryl-CoA lyase
VQQVGDRAPVHAGLLADPIDAVGGICGCPFAPAATGNIATEDLLYLLHRSGVQTGVTAEAVAPATACWPARSAARCPAC